MFLILEQLEQIMTSSSLFSTQLQESILAATFNVSKTVAVLYNIQYIVGISVEQEGDFVYCNEWPRN